MTATRLANGLNGNVGVARAPVELLCVEALSAEQVAAHHRIRHAVFVEEQGIFAGSDFDEHDTAEGVVRVVAMWGGDPVGAVRLYSLAPDRSLWKGDRLAVLAPCRTYGVGAPLVRFAVAHARVHDGRRMVAHIQLPNVAFFRRLGWSPYGDVEDYVGRTHQPMDIQLAPGPPGPPGSPVRP